jgi:hypothetical protein
MAFPKQQIPNLLEGQQQQFQNPPPGYNPFLQLQGGGSGSSSQQDSEFLPDDNIFQYNPLPMQFNEIAPNGASPNNINAILEHLNIWVRDICFKINSLHIDDGKIRKRTNDLMIKQMVDNDKSEGRINIFGRENAMLSRKVNLLYDHIIKNKPLNDGIWNKTPGAT